MDIIRDNIFLIILLLVGAISQWLKARGEARKNEETGYDPGDFEEMMEEAERRASRRAVPPPLPMPPPLPPAAFPHPQGGVSVPAPALQRKSREAAPAFDTASELARQQEIADKLKEMKRTRGARETSDNLLSRKRAAGAPSAATAVPLKARLGNRRELRQAFVLKEILEKPLGLR